MSLAAWPRVRPAVDLADSASFLAAVVVILAFSQAWVLLVVGPVDVVPQETSAALRNVFFPVYLLCLLLVLGRLEALGAAAYRAPLLVLLVALTFVSAIWSIDPDVTQRRAVAVFFTTLGGAALAVRYAWPSLLEVLASSWAAMIVVSALMIIFLPSYGVMTKDFPGAWRGAWGHKNILGYEMAIGFVVFVSAAILAPHRRRLWLAGAAGSLALVAGSQSVTSILSCAAAAAAIALVWLGRRGPVGAVAAVWIGAAAAVLIGLVLLMDPALLFQLVGKDVTLTGRTSIWQAVMRQIALRPATGYGFGAVWDSTSRWGPLPWISHDQGFVVNEAHNSWLAVWLGLGYAGLVAAALTLADVWRRIVVGLFRRPSAYFAAPFAAIFTLHTVTESVILDQNDVNWMMFAALAFKLGLPEA